MNEIVQQGAEATMQHERDSAELSTFMLLRNVAEQGAMNLRKELSEANAIKCKAQEHRRLCCNGCWAKGKPKGFSCHQKVWGKVCRNQELCIYLAIYLPVSPHPSVFFMLLTWKCASRQNGEHFFDILTWTSAPTPSVFTTWFDFQISFVPLQRAIFIPHLARWPRTRHFS